MAQSERKLSLQAFLQLLTSNSLPIQRAMGVAGKIYKEFNTASTLGELTDVKLSTLGVTDKDDRKLVLSAIVKAGYRGKVVEKAKAEEVKKRKASSRSNVGSTKDEEHGKAGPSSASTSSNTSRTTNSPSPAKKRRTTKVTDKNEFLPDKIHEQGDEVGSLEFDEISDEEALKGKFVVVNRAPVMMAWSFLVAERMGFQREEALSIASVYTEMNAISKGASLGVYPKSATYALSVAPGSINAPNGGGSQPYVDLMGRRIPLIQLSSSDSIPSIPTSLSETAGQWRALSPETGTPVSPASAYSYITRSLRQTAPAILGAMRLLADSWAGEVNKVGWGLYADFRPEVDGWGKRGRVSCDVILGLRKKGSEKREEVKEVKNEGENEKLDPVEQAGSAVLKQEPTFDTSADTRLLETTHDVEEYEAALDVFDAEELDSLP